MPRTGGPATITGIGFQIWFTAYKLVDAFFDDSIKVRPEVHFYHDPADNNLKLSSIDDLFIQSNSKQEFYNIKYRTSTGGNWTFSQLKHGKVLEQFKKQFIGTPNAYLYFVTQSACPIFDEILPRAANCSSEGEVEKALEPNNYIQEWNRLKEELGFSDDEMLKFAKQVKFTHIINIEELQEKIKERLLGHITNLDIAHYSLYHLVEETAKNGKTITQSDIIKHFEKDNIHLKSHLKVEELLYKITAASSALANIPHTLNNLQHVERTEVEALVDWIKAPLKGNDSQIAVLTGKAGYGKTVIMRDLLERLLNEGIPVLGVKTDILTFDSIEDLNRELGLSEGIKPIMATIVEKFGKGVVLFDQLDALSLSMSKDRKPLNMYFNLISQMSSIKGLKIIISVRDFDLQYDPVLRNFKNRKTIEVGELSDQQVDEVLTELKVQKDTISKTLFNLLKIPLHLEIFSKIYRPNLNITVLNSLQDFYDKYWEQEIAAISDRKLQDSVVKAINVAVKKMNESKTLTIPIALLDNYNDGKNFLLRKSILLRKQRNRLQFFHSTFFDYCYARKIVAEQTSLIDVILHQHQGLFIRSQVKQVLSFLRGSDFQRYLVELKQFLTNPDVRYHIRLLVINQLGFQQDPTEEEQQIVKGLLEKNDDFKKHFINSIQSEKWLRFMIDSSYIQDFLKSGDKKLVDIVVWKLGSFINSSTEIVLNFLDNFPNIDKKDDYICNILLRLDHWENEKAVDLFQKELPTIKGLPRIHYNDLLRRIADYNPVFASKLFFGDLTGKVNSITSSNDLYSKECLNSDDVEIFEKLINLNPSTVLPVALQIINTLVDKTRVGSKTKFYYDTAFDGYEYYETDLYPRWHFLSLATVKLERIASSSKVTFTKLIKGFSTSNSLTLLKIVMKGYDSNPELYINESHKLLLRDGLMESMVGAESLITLLKDSYSYFSKEQKEEINKIILSIAPNWEKEREKGRPSMIGLSKYKLLCAIPKEELLNNPVMEKQFLALKYKFGECTKSAHPTLGVAKFVGPPLPKTAYEKMNLEQWLSSFKKYDESTKWLLSGGNSLRGGIEQHSQVFTEQVFKSPDKFYDFIFNLGKSKDVSAIYFQAGLDGLIKAQYGIEKVKRLVKTYWKMENKDLRKSIINAIKYINDKDNLDLDLIKILKEYALTDPDPESELWRERSSDGEFYYGEDAFTYGISTVRGWASAVLGIHGYKTNYPDFLFDIFNKIVDDRSIAVKCCLIRFLPSMINWDINKTFKLFVKLTKDVDTQVIENGLECIRYLMTEKNFESFFIPVIKEVVASTKPKSPWKDQIDKYKGEIIAFTYVEGLPGSEQLLEESLKVNNRLKLGMISFSSRNLNNPDRKIREKSQNIYMRFINDDSDETSREYDRIFKNFNISDFRRLYPLLVKYSKSLVIRKKHHFFFNLLAEVVSSEPEECVDLIEPIKDLQVPYGVYSDLPTKAVQILINAYNYTQQNSYKEKIMDILDSMLQNEFYRNIGIQVLDRYDRN